MRESKRGEQKLGDIIKEHGLPVIVYDSDFKACLRVEKDERWEGTYKFTMLDDTERRTLLKGHSYGFPTSRLQSWDVEFVSKVE
jgi:hypothetical protein